MMEIVLNIIPQHFIHTEMKEIIKNIQTFAAALKKFVISKIGIAIVIILDNKMDFTAIMIPQKTNQPMQYWRKKIRKV